MPLYFTLGRVMLGHLRVTLGNFFSELHPKVRQTCFITIIVDSFLIINLFYYQHFVAAAGGSVAWVPDADIVQGPQLW